VTPPFLLLAKLLAGPLFDWLKTRDAAQLSRAALEAEIEKALIAQQQAIAAEQAKLVAAEISGSWLQRSWRPIVALTAFFSYWFVIVGYPFALAWGLLPFVRFGEQGLQNLFWLTVTCVGGYIGGRSLEKIMRKD
jgi:hypothetical protein